MSVSKFRLIVNVVICTALLGACSAAPVRESLATSRYSTNQEAVRAFQQTCIASLPNFRNFAQHAEEAGLVAFGRVGAITSAFQVPDTRILIGASNIPRGKACSMTAESNEDPRSLGNAILASLRASTGSGAEQRFANIRNFVIQLPNGSLITHEYEDVGLSIARNTFILTEPISEQQVYELLGVRR